GFVIRVVTLPPGKDPLDLASAFNDLLAAAVPYATYRVQAELDRAPNPQAAHERVTDVLNRMPESPERQDAWRLVNDRLGMIVQIQRGATASTTAAGIAL